MMDDDGKEVPIGEAGELCAWGPQVFKVIGRRIIHLYFHPGVGSRPATFCAGS